MFKRINCIKNTTKINPTMVGLSILLGTGLITSVAMANLADKPSADSAGNMAHPTLRYEPKYPIKAAQNKQEGAVILQFDITAEGGTDNIKVVDSFPDGVFDKVATDALKKWQYKPRIQGGKALRQTGLRVQLDFRMDKPYAGQSAAVSKVEKNKSNPLVFYNT